jgi:tetratricopeptide (TPR) repeat protein
MAVSAKARPRTASARPEAVPAPVPAPAPPPPPPAPRKPGFYEAVAIYERGVQALQRHDFAGAAGYFRTVLERYPDERELLERARLYLRVCERETSRQPAPDVKSPAERVYAATVALNSGDHSGALDHLQRALGEDPESDHAHYIMAVALGMRNRADEALEHLQQAIALNPENRGLAKQDPDLDSIRDHNRFRDALDTPPAPNRRLRPARRR